MSAYIFHITPYDLAFLGVIFIGLSFALQLGFANRINRSANRFLSLALVTMVLWLFWVLSKDIGLGTYFSRWSWLPLQFSLALGPLIFFYVLKITRPNYPLRFKDLLHFSPLLVQLIAQLLEIKESVRTGTATYNTLIFHQLNPLFHLLTFISVSAYLYASHKVIERFYQDLKFNGGDRYRYELRWLHNLLIGFGLLWLLWIPFTAIDYLYYHNQLGIHAYYPYYILLAVMAIWMGAVVFLRPEVSVSPDPPLFFKLPPPAALKQKGAWLQQAMEVNRFYQNADLSLGSLAEMLDLHSHELSRIINTGLKKNFNDFINEYRIREVTRKMQDPAYDRITLLGIAFDAGFNSKSTFNRTFRQMMGKSPAEYKDYLKKERPTYHLRPYSHSTAVTSFQEEATAKWSFEKLNRNYMYMNYFKFAFRKLKRNSSFSLINIFGLAIGIAASLLIYRVIENETSYDSYHVKKDQIYRVVSTTSKSSNGEVIANSASVPLPLSYAMRLDFPQFEKVAAIVNAGTPQVYVPGKGHADGKQFKENTGAFYAESTLFDIFDYAWLAGNASRLKEPNTVVLSESIADKYFGDWKQALGKTIELWSWKDKFIVTGVFRDLPYNTDIPVRMAMSYVTIHPPVFQNVNDTRAWQYPDNVFKTECFLLLSKNQGIGNLANQLPAFVKKYYKEDTHNQTQTTLQFQPLAKMHLDERFNTYPGDALPLKELWALGLIGLFLLLIACINFINLATAQSVIRAKEIGVRKVLGSNRQSLIKQLLIEAAMITSFAIFLGYVLATLTLPFVEQLIQKPLSLNLLDYPSILLFLIAAGFVITFLAGFYPAAVLSGFQPAEAFRNVKTQSVFGISVRRSLVVTQFVIAQLLIIGTLVVVEQMNYFRNRPMGFEKKAIVIIDLPSNNVDRQKYDYLKQEMLQIPGVIAASYCMDPPSSDEKVYSPIYYNNSSKKNPTDFETQFADTSYLNTFGIHLVAGRLPNPADTVRELLINEAAVGSLGLRSPEQVIGKKLSYNSHQQYPVVGVIHDYNSRSLRDPILPLVLTTNKQMYTDIALKIDPEKMFAAMTQVQTVYKRILPSYVYDPVYFDDSIWQYYKKEAITSQLFKISAALAIALSCLGLYGLVSFVVVQKTKEVGIRKVLGASVKSILYLFSKEFIALIAIAFLIAGPVGYYVMHRWLSGFYNHIDQGWSIYVLAVLISLVIAAITVGYTTFKAAIANPVRSLRSE